MTRLPPSLARSWRSWTSSQLEATGPYWMQLAWTAIFGTAVGLFFTLIGFVFNARGDDWTDLDNWRHWLGVNLFISYFISFLTHFLFDGLVHGIGRARIRAWEERQRRWFFNLVPLVGVLVGWPLAVWLVSLKTRVAPDGPVSINVSFGMLTFVLMFFAIVSLYFNGRARAEAAERREAEARLRLLQGQIEPHFLFNTLANVASLVEADPQRARHMLEAFVDYLRASFGGLRDGHHSLGKELLLVEAYLRVLGLRMEDRLRWRLDVPEALHRLPLPALMLQPLVENAIHHGLEPKIEGGEIRVSGQQVGRTLVLEVCDNGLGLPDPTLPRPARPAARPGSGHALANIRARLTQTFGEQASLVLAPRPQGGVIARLQMPLPEAAPESALPDTPR